MAYLMFLIADLLRNLGRYKFADIACYRIKPTPIRCLSDIGSLLVIALYLVAQKVGAGELIQLLFGINDYLAFIIIGCLMVIYVLFGGMVAPTWVRIDKVLLLLVVNR